MRHKIKAAMFSRLNAIKVAAVSTSLVVASAANAAAFDVSDATGTIADGALTVPVLGLATIAFVAVIGVFVRLRRAA